MSSYISYIINDVHTDIPPYTLHHLLAISSLEKCAYIYTIITNPYLMVAWICIITTSILRHNMAIHV